MDSVFDFCLIEIDQESEAKSRELQVGQYLRFVDWENHLDGFQFDDHRVVYEQIDSKSTVKPKLPIPEWHQDLAFDVKAAVVQFVFKALFVDTLEQTRAKSLMHLKGGVDDDARDLVDRVGYRCPL